MITHQLSATTPDDPSYEIRPSHWNQEHAQAFTILGNTAGASTISGTNIVLSAGPNATISVNGSTLVFSGGAGAAGNTGYLSDDAGVTASLGTVRFSNSNGIGWGINGQTITASHNGLTTAALSNHSHGNPTLNLTNLSGTTASNSAGLTLSLSAAAQGLTSQSNQNVTAANGGFAFQTLSFSNTQGVSFATSAGSAIVASVETSYAASNHSHGNPTLALTNLSGTTASNSAGLTLSLSAGAGGAFSAGVSGGNTAGDTGATGTRVVFAGGNNVTLSQATDANGATITVSGANAGGAQTGISGVIVSDATYTSGTISFSNQNGVTIGSSVNGASQYVRLSVATSYAASNHSHGNPTLALTNLTGTTASASNGLTLSLSAAAPQTGISAIYDGANSISSGTIRFTNANGVTFTINGQTLSGSVATTYRASNDALGLNTAQTNVTWTANSAGLSLNAGGYAGTASGFTGANISGSMTHNTAGLSLSLSVAAPGAAAENNNVNLLGANTAGNTTASGSTLGFSGINLTLSGTNASVINFSAPATSSLVGASGIVISTAGSTISVGMSMISYFDNMEAEWANSTTMQPLQSTSHIQPFVIEGPLTFGFLRMPMSASMSASSTGVTTGNSQFSYGLSYSYNFVVYSRGVGASSMSLQSVISTQLTARQSINVSANANSTQFSYTNRATYQMSTGPVGFTYDYSSSAASLNFHTSGMTAITGLKMMEFAWGASLLPGQYWLMYGISSASASQFNAQGSRLFNNFSQYGMSQPNLQFGTIGDATQNSVGLFHGQGSFTTAGGGTTASLPISAVTSSSAHNKAFFAVANIA